MKTINRARILAILLTAMLGSLLSAKPAQAAMFVKYRVYLNDQFILVAGTFDNGHTDADGLWNYLKKLPLSTPRTVDYAELMPVAERLKFLSDDLKRHQAGLPSRDKPFVVKPDAGNPLQATLEGKIKVEGRYSYTREVSSLRLVRKSKESHWQIDPEEVDRLHDLPVEDVPQR